MNDLQQYITKRKMRDRVFAKDFDSSYEAFKISALLQQAGAHASMTQDGQPIEKCNRATLSRGKLAKKKSHDSKSRVVWLVHEHCANR